MPKPLREAQPSSSVARLLDVDAASRALATIPIRSSGANPGLASSTVASSDQASALSSSSHMENRPRDSVGIKREFIFSPSTDESIARLIDLYRRSTGTRLSGSHVLRAMLRGVSTCMDSLQQEAARMGRLKLPSNASGWERQRDEFEDRIAEAFINGIRSAAAYRPGRG